MKGEIFPKGKKQKQTHDHNIRCHHHIWLSIKLEKEGIGIKRPEDEVREVDSTDQVGLHYSCIWQDKDNDVKVVF